MVKTKEQIASLKSNWENDPIWDIENTEGFEEYKEELLQFRKETEQKWKQTEEERIVKSCAKYGCNAEMLHLLEWMENKIIQLEKREGLQQ